MSDILIFILIVGLWLVINRVILPKAGVPT